MRQADELPVEQCILAQAPHRDAHPAVQVTVEFGLRAVVLFKIGDELLGCMRQRQRLWLTAEISPCLENVFARGLLIKFHRYRRQMTVGYRHADALCGNNRRLRADDDAILYAAPDFQRFLLALFLFAADVGYHIV